MDSAEQALIVHLEIQNQNQSLMPDRMLRYLTDIRLSYPNQMVYQCLLVYWQTAAVNGKRE